ncbi:MAG TPA: alpha/beta fold hydrolase [Methylomusa anaerophila]|uniref:Carboxylesterase n=1 Tax=Methylomusa anaerophila TaxID=1930071 RepID=A0A348AL26_9FIRM|nr:alpha/beta fold hydrolase [Methylomusa anaerophila]BBB91774.1 carboxylesterase [Methylomusa anaerophila]HML88489.1 alpha/beta fold hydrolase [Methylomusa anaerophila]
MAILRGAEPFLLPGGRRGVLVVHGFTGSPSEMRLIGEYLHQQGFTVLGPRLCGHGTTPEEMSRTAWQHWYSAVEDGYHYLAGMCDEVLAVGLSMGGLMVLKLSSEYEVGKTAILSAPIYIAERRLRLLPVYRMFRDYVSRKRKRIAGIDDVYSVTYDRTPLRSLTSLLDFIKQVDRLLPAITTPSLIVQSLTEHTVRPESAQHIFDRLGSKDKKLVWLKKSGHVITLDVEKEQVFNEVVQFFG